MSRKVAHWHPPAGSLDLFPSPCCSPEPLWRSPLHYDTFACLLLMKDDDDDDGDDDDTVVVFVVLVSINDFPTSSFFALLSQRGYEWQSRVLISTPANTRAIIRATFFPPLEPTQE